MQSGDAILVIGTEPPVRPIGGPDPIVRPYTGAGNKDLTFGDKAISLGCFLGDATKCVIDCAPDGGRGFDLSNASSGVVVSGFTIRNGSASYGGGINIYNSSPTITGNIIEDCTATGVSNGGGIYCSGSANPMISTNTIRGNKALGGGGGGIYVASRAIAGIRGNLVHNNRSANGGGIEADGKVTIENCTIQSNIATSVRGGRISLAASGPSTIKACNIVGNHAPGEGGGVSVTDGAWAVISKCLIAGNSVTSAYGVGGGISSFGTYDSFDPRPAWVTIFNSVIANNEAAGQGGGVFLYLSPVSETPTIANTVIARNRLTQSDASGGGIYGEALTHFDIRNCTIAHNSVPTTGNAYGGGIWLDSLGALITNSILWGNQAGPLVDSAQGPQLAMSGGSATVHYTDAQGGLGAV